MKIKLTRTDQPSLDVTLRSLPTTCPRCHNHIQASFLNCAHQSRSGAEIIFQCPASACQGLFIATYTLSTNNGVNSGTFTRCSPTSAKAVLLTTEIKEISPQFQQIYEQAVSAEALNLDQIFGVGLRKALEFLIKDYCIQKNPEKTEEIKKKFLGNVIQDYLGGTNIGRCAERATWLGNDETHYVRKWEAHDITDLKRLIELTMHWITQELETDKFMAAMPKKPTQL